MNLARRPFANLRPLRRLGVALWVVGAAFAVIAGVLYWRSLFGIEGGRDTIAATERAAATERRRLAAAEAALAAIDLRRQNVEAAFLEARLRERTFGWSALFEHLGEVLPRHVRLRSLSPQAVDPGAVGARSRRAGSMAVGGRVQLQMTGVAADDKALTDLLDRLFASRWFVNPSLPIERSEEGEIGFSLGVTYLPAGDGRVEARPSPPAPTPTVEEAGAAPPESAGEAR